MHPGEVVDGRFEILQSTSSGGMSVVYRAHDRASRRDVAMKVLLERGEQMTDRFTQEIQLLSELDHPHIVGYVAHGITSAGAPYLVMPWLQGHDLQERLRDGPLTIDDTLTLARCAADALAYLHRRQIVHRDLKPSNLFLPDGKIEQVKIIDMGIARTSVPARPLTVSGVLLGTPGFIAPEQAREQGEIAPAVDIFALGCVLFECLTGKRLFDGFHVMAVLAKILMEEAPRARELRAEVPDALDRLVHRMVAKDPAHRPRDGTELARWLEKSVHTSLRSQPPPALTARERRVVSVLIVVLPPSDEHRPATSDATVCAAHPVQAAARPLAIRVEQIDARTAIALAPAGLSAADQASVLARFGRSVAATYPGARVAIATGTAVTGAHVPIGEAIDRGVTIVRDATGDEGVCVDEVTAALITSRFDMRRLGGRVVVAAERISLDPTRTLLGRPTSCVGRDREIAILEATFAECVSGGGPRVVLLTAAAGMGKSRVRHEFVRRLRAASPTSSVLQCRGDPLHMTTPYAQIAQAVRHGLGLSDGEPVGLSRRKLAAHVASLLPDGDVHRVRAFLGELVGVPFDDAEYLPLRAARQSADAMADQVRLALADTVRAWCRTRPVVLVLEDLHWADATSVASVDFVLRKLQGEQLFVLALARPEVHDRFRDLWSKRHITVASLPPLPPGDCTQLVREVIGEKATKQDIQRIVERSEGNAFYLEELIRAAVSDSQPARASGAHPRHDAWPETVLAMAQARLERLQPTERKILRAASIFGELFSMEGVSALTGDDPGLESAFGSLVEHEAFLPSEQSGATPGQDFVFRHVFLRGAAYATLTDEDRALGHRLAAKWLEDKQADREVVALHWLEAGEPNRAAAAFARAGESRMRRVHADAAARCAVRALLVGDPHAAGMEETVARIGMLADALLAWRRIATDDVLLGLERHVALPGRDAGASTTRTIAHVALERALKALRESHQAEVRAIALARAARALAALWDFAGAKALLAEASAIAEGNVGLRDVRYESARVASLAGEYAAVIDIITTTVLPADARERLEMLVLLATAVVVVDGHEALARSLDFVVRAEALATESGGDPVALIQCAKARVLCFGFARKYAEAAAAAETAVSLSRHAGLRYEECTHLHNVGDACVRMGQDERARAALVASCALANEIGAERIRLHDEVLIAYLDGKTSRIEELADGFRAANDVWHELHARYWLARRLAADRATDARREVARALDLARRLRVRLVVEDCERALAELAGPASA